MKKFTKELQGKTAVEMQKEIQKLTDEIAKMVMDERTNPSKDVNGVYKKRKQLAVYKTISSTKKS